MDTSFSFAIGLIGAVVAVWGIHTQRMIARRRATFDHIAKSESDADLIAAKRKFVELAKQEGGLSVWAQEDKEKSEEAQSIRIVLNDFELIAIGIQCGIIDYKFYERWFKSGVVRHWKHAHPFVAALRTRTGNEALYHEFEQLAGWFNKTRPPARNRSLAERLGF